MQYIQGTFASGQRYVPNINSSLPSPNARLEQTSWLRISLGMIVLWITEKASMYIQKHYPKRDELASYTTTTCAWGSSIFIYSIYHHKFYFALDYNQNISSILTDVTN